MSLPLILVLNISLCANSFRLYMPHDSISKMDFQFIKLRPVEEYVDSLVYELLIKRQKGIKFGLITFENLFYTKRVFDTGLSFIYRTWKNAIVEYYTRLPHPALIETCDGKRDGNINDCLLACRYWCFPLKSHIELLLANNNSDLAMSLLTNDNLLLDHVKCHLKQLKVYNEKVSVAFDCLKALCKILAFESSDVPITNLYLNLLNGNFFKDHFYVTSIMKLIDDISLNELHECLLWCMEVVKRFEHMKELSHPFVLLEIKINLYKEYYSEEDRHDCVNVPNKTQLFVEFKTLMKQVFKCSLRSLIDVPLYELIYVSNLKSIDEVCLIVLIVFFFL